MQYGSVGKCQTAAIQLTDDATHTNVVIRDVNAQIGDKRRRSHRGISPIPESRKVKQLTERLELPRRFSGSGEGHGHDVANQQDERADSHGPGESDTGDEPREHDGQRDASCAAASGDDAHGECSALLEVMSGDGKGRLHAIRGRQPKQYALREELLPDGIALRERREKKGSGAAESSKRIEEL